MIFLNNLFIFCLFSVIGWVLELIYRSIMSKKFINPGFMTGCVVPLYGFGAVILNIVCNYFVFIKSEYKVIIIFILSTLLLSILEFISGFILLKFFNLKLWDYSEYKYNYKGFVCLEFSFVWGLLSLIYYVLIFPWINNFSTSFISNMYCLFSLGIFVGIFLVDLSVSISLLNNLIKYAKILTKTINVEKVKLEARMKVSRKKFLHTIYPYISTSKFLKDRIGKK